MPEYLIDAMSMATFLVTSTTEEDAIKEVKRLTKGFDLHVQVAWNPSVILVDVTCRDDDPEIVDVRDDDSEDVDD